MPAEGYGDPLSAPFWQAAARRELVIQHCRDCGTHQFYARPFCLTCQSDAIEWTTASGTGTVYSKTTVRRKFSPEFEPPYVIAVVSLDEGPRLLTTIVDGEAQIGDRVRVTWKARQGAPPLPVFAPIRGAAR